MVEVGVRGGQEGMRHGFVDGVGGGVDDYLVEEVMVEFV